MPVRTPVKVTLLILFLLLAALATASGSPSNSGQPSTAHPTTISGTFQLPSNMKDLGNDWFIAGFASEQGRDADQLELRWVHVESGWFPYWELRLASRAAILLNPKTGTPTNQLQLQEMTPVPGNNYAYTLSWDPVAGGVSILLRDVTANRELYANGFTTMATPATATASTPVPSTTATATAPTIIPHYVPVGTRWDPGLQGAQQFSPIRRFEHDSSAAVRVQVPGLVPSGEFRLYLNHGGVRTELGRSQAAGATTYLPLPVDRLPAGRSTLTLEYVANETTHLSWNQDITVGNVAVRYDPVVRHPDLGVVTSMVRLASQSPLADVRVTITANVAELQWDDTRRGYRETVLATAIPLIDERLDLPAGELVVPVQIAAPAQAGLYKVTFNATLSPEVLEFASTTPTYFSMHAPANIAPGDTYTIAVLPDTQYYAQNHPHIFMRQIEWLAANAAEKNIGLVLHVGDITNANTFEQWRVAADSMKLLNYVVPYVLAIGNHDNFPVGKANGQTGRRGDSRINEFFWPDEFAHLGGMLEPGHLENAYYTLNIAGTDYLVVSLEFGPPNEALDWANTVVEAHPGHTVIVLTHMYTSANGKRTFTGQIAMHYDIGKNPDTTVNDGDGIWLKLVRRHPNIKFIFSGHIHSPVIPHDLVVGEHGNVVVEALMDYQSEQYGGNGYLVLWEFRPDGEVHVQSYSPYLGQDKLERERGFSNSFVLQLDNAFADVMAQP